MNKEFEVFSPEEKICYIKTKLSNEETKNELKEKLAFKDIYHIDILFFTLMNCLGNKEISLRILNHNFIINKLIIDEISEINKTMSSWENNEYSQKN